MKKVIRVIVLFFLFSLNTITFQNCARMTSEKSSNSNNSGFGNPGGPVQISARDCTILDQLSYDAGDLVVSLKQSLDSRKSLNLSAQVDDQVISWQKAVPMGKELKLRMGPLYKAGQEIKLSIEQVSGGESTVKCSSNNFSLLQIPPASQFEILTTGVTQSDLPDHLYWENNRLYVDYNLQQPANNNNRYFAVEHRFLKSNISGKINLLKKLPIPLRYPLTVGVHENNGGLNYWDLSGQNGNYPGKHLVRIYLAADSQYSGWRPIDNKIKYCEKLKPAVLPANKFFGLESIPIDCTPKDLLSVGFTGVSRYYKDEIFPEARGKHINTLTPNTLPHTPDQDTAVLNMSDDHARGIASGVAGNASLIMFDFEHGTQDYSGKGTGSKYAIIGKEIQKINPQAVVIDWWQGGINPDLKSLKDIEKISPFLSQKNQNENSIFYTGIKGLNKWNGEVRVGINNQYIARYSSINNERYVDAVTGFSIGAYTPLTEGAAEDNHLFIPNIIYGARLSKAYFPNKQAVCSGWWLVEPLMREPWIPWSLTSSDKDTYVFQARSVASAELAREAALWCLIEGDGYYGWDGTSFFGHGPAKPAMFDHAYSLREYGVGGSFNGQNIDRNNGFPGFGWSQSTTNITHPKVNSKNIRTPEPLHQQDYYLRAVSEVSYYKEFFEKGKKADLPVALSESELDKTVSDPNGNDILISTKYKKPFVVSFTLPTGQTLIVARMNSADYSDRNDLYVKINGRTIVVPVFGSSTAFQVVGQ